MRNNKSPGVTVKFILLNSELASTGPCCNMLQILLGRKKYEEEMSDEHSPYHKNYFSIEKSILGWKSKSGKAAF